MTSQAFVYCLGGRVLLQASAVALALAAKLFLSFWSLGGMTAMQ